jgi:hypothetical protein
MDIGITQQKDSSVLNTLSSSQNMSNFADVSIMNEDLSKPEPERNDLGLEFVTDILSDSGSQVSSQHFVRETKSESSYGGGDDQDAHFSFGGGGFASERRENVMSDEETQHKKIFYLSEMKRLRQNNPAYDIPHLSMGDSLNQIKNEYDRIKFEIERKVNINMCKNGLLFMTNMLELGNNKMDLFGLHLDGWSSQMHKEIDTYEEVFIELYEKYGGSVKVGPEIKLLMMILSSAFMFHMQKQMFASLSGNKSNSMFENLASKISQNMGATQSLQKEEPKLKEPSFDIDAFMDNVSSIGSEDDVYQKQEFELPDIKIKLPAKKRGRKAKV